MRSWLAGHRHIHFMSKNWQRMPLKINLITKQRLDLSNCGGCLLQRIIILMGKIAMTKKLWAGRYTAETNHDVEQYTASIHFDTELAQEDILGSMAHAAMLCHCGIISHDENNLIQKGLQSIAENISQDNIQFRIEDEDIHMDIERILTENIGDTAKKLHTARSRNDQVALDLHLYLRKKMLCIITLLNDLQMTLLNLAKNHTNTILPGYTHLQRAQPIRLAQHWLAYVAMFQRDIDRLENLWLHVNKSPLGACALTGTSFPTDKHFVANELKFDGIYINTLDAVSDRDFIVEFLSAGSLIMMHLSRMSEELILWSSQEFNFISFDEAYCTGSSIMPQKKNPDVVELGRGKTGRVYGALFAILTMLKGLPLAYNKDMQEDKEPLFDVVKQLSQTLKIYSPLLATLKVNTDVMYNAANVGYLNATILAEYLVTKGMSFRSAHEIVGKMVALCIQKNCQLDNLSLQEMNTFSPLISDDIYQVLSIANACESCIPSALLIDEIEFNEKQLLTNQAWVKKKVADLLSVHNKYF